MAPMTKPRILIVDNDPEISRFCEYLSGEGYEVTECRTGEEAYSKALRLRPDLVISEAVLTGMDGYSLVRKLRQNSVTAPIPILMLTSKGERGDKIAGFEAGVDDYVAKPFHPEEVSHRIKRLVANARGASQPHTELHKPRRAIAFFSPKGGVGKTTLAVNLSVALRSRTAKSVVLFDADFFFGNAGVQLNLPADHTILDLIKHIDDLDAQLAERILAHHASGLRVLLGPARPEQGDLITPNHVTRLLAFLSDLYSYVIVDCQPSYDERILRILEQADDIILVVTPEIGPFRNISLFLDMAASIGVSLDKVHILLNRSNSQVGIEARQIEQTLNRRIDYRVVSGGQQVVASTNRGTPLVIEKPKHPFSRQIFEIADSLEAGAEKMTEQTDVPDALRLTAPAMVTRYSEA
jgi:pilus assembly protein CpaE